MQLYQLIHINALIFFKRKIELFNNLLNFIQILILTYQFELSWVIDQVLCKMGEKFWVNNHLP